jgi:hypothetical protein
VNRVPTMDETVPKWGKKTVVRVSRPSGFQDAVFPPWDVLLQDGFKEFNQAGDALRGRLRIQFIDKYGEAEAGVDGGGLFKDFMESIVREGFDPNRGLFRSTAENRLYPNPAVNQVVPGGLHYINFLGKIVGKALYEVLPPLW